MNARILRVPSNGQARVADEISRRLGLKTVAPRPGMESGTSGHLWEQSILPLKLGGAPLWSPSTSAPVLYRNQIVTIHDIGFIDAPQYFAPRFTAAYGFITRAVARRARHIVTVSDFSRSRLMAHFGSPDDGVTTIYPGVADAFTVQPAADVVPILARHGLSDVPYLIAFSGSDPRKNIVGVLAAWAALGKARGEAKLVLFGRASNAKVFGVTPRHPSPPGVVHVGPVADHELACLFTGSQGLVFPSFYEGFGLPVIEAAACGAPVLASTLASLPEIAPDGALLVDPANIAQIADAMSDLIEATPDPKARARTATAIRQRFSWDTAARSYKALFAATFC